MEDRMNLVRREVIVQVVAGVVLLLLTALGSYTLGTISGALRKSIGITAWETDKSENGTFFDLRCEYRWVTNQNLGMFGDYWALRLIPAALDPDSWGIPKLLWM